MNGDILAAFCILFVACGLMVWHTVTRTLEGFEAQAGDRCGVDLPPCPMGTRCINGYCMSPNAPTLPVNSDLEVKPSDRDDAGSFLHTE